MNPIYITIVLVFLILNIILVCVNHESKNYKTAYFNAFAAGTLFLFIIKMLS